MEVKNWPRGPPSSDSICLTATEVSKATTESCSLVSSSRVACFELEEMREKVRYYGVGKVA